MKKSIMDIVEKQIGENHPPETRETLNRLMSQGISEEDAKNYISQAVCIEVWDIMNHKKEFDTERFVKNLKKLPELPTE
jgi:hypothetical protein